MSKRSRGSRPATSKASPKARSDQGKRSSSAGARPGRSRTWIIGGVVVMAIIVVAALVLTQTDLLNPNGGGGSVIGGTQDCAGNSDFVQAIGFGQRSALDTRAKYVDGVALREIDENGNIARTYQHPSWTSAGTMSAFQRDEFGNIFIIPTPFINILDNPPEKANIIYRIDGETGEMTPFIDLPALAPVSQSNPFGLLDITYDCDTHTLYASSVFGSTYEDVAGAIYQVDPRSAEVKSTFEHVDAFGIGVFNGSQGKRLYYGLARSPEIYSVALDASGAFTDDVQLEFSLDDLGTSPDLHAQAITFQGASQLVITMAQFDYNLVSPTESQQTLLSYLYHPEDDTWELIASQNVSEA
ncbi:MAG: hypothetical protein IT320_24325 [Anaerolineae bacterium]|nr:hypothetical protein [Anaerolineae bacterium]